MNELCSQRRSNACSHRLKLPSFENRSPPLGWADRRSEPGPGARRGAARKKERAGGARVRTRK